MKKALFLTVLFVSLGLTGQQIKWMTFNEAIAAHRNMPRKILVQITDGNSAGSTKMELTTFTHPVIVNYINKYFYAVKFDASSNETVNFHGRSFNRKKASNNNKHELITFLSIHAFPTTVFLDETLEPVTSLMGTFTAREMEPYLSLVGTDDYLKVKSKSEWETYRENFKHKIK